MSGFSEREVSYNGAVTFWSLTEMSEHAPLYDSFKAIGMEELCPKPMSNYTTLKAAMDAIQGQGNILVRRLAGKAGWCIVREDIEKTGNKYSILTTVLIDEKMGKLTFNGGNVTLHQEISQNFNNFKGKVSAKQIGYNLVVVVDHLLGHPLRQHGVVYWLPAKSLETWEKIATALSTTSKSNLIYLIRHTFDADSIKAVQESIAVNLMSDVKALYDEIISDDIPTERRQESRHRRISDLKDKIRAISEATGITIGSVNDAVQHLERAEAASVLTD